MSRVRKNYLAHFQAKVALAALRADAPISEMASTYSVHATVIHRWKREALAFLENRFSGKQEKMHTAQEAHIHKLHAKIGQLSVERDFLVDVSNHLRVGSVKKW